MRRQRLFLLSVILSAVWLYGCGRDHTPPPPEAKPAQPTVFDPMVRQIDKAEKQADRMEDRMKDLNAELEKSE